MPHVSPGVRLIAEGSETLIGSLPNDAPKLSKNDEVVYGKSESSLITYKIQKVRYVAEYSNTTNPGIPNSYSVYGRLDLIVSVVS